MGFESLLTVCNIDENNFNCLAEHIFPFKRKEDGTFDPINIYCGYETRFGILYLRIGLTHFKKVYLYQMNYEIEKLEDPDWAEFEITFDLNATLTHLDPFNDCNKTTVCIFTCWCFKKECECDLHLEYSDYVIEKLTVIKPSNSNVLKSKIFYMLSEDFYKETMQEPKAIPSTENDYEFLTDKLLKLDRKLAKDISMDELYNLIDRELSNKENASLPTDLLLENVFTKLTKEKFFFLVTDELYKKIISKDSANEQNLSTTMEKMLTRRKNLLHFLIHGINKN